MPSERVRVRRSPQRGRYAADDVRQVLDASPVAHVAFVMDGQPYCIPFLHARVGGTLYLHGSTASRAMCTLAGGAPACVTVTVLDGLVLARSVFEHSANYRSVTVLGRFARVAHDERALALEEFTNRLVPGRWGEVRRPNSKESAQTMVVAMPVEEASVKVRTGPPTDDDSPDAAVDVWAGVIPMSTHLGAPQPSPGLRHGIPIPPSVRTLYATTPACGAHEDTT